MMLLATFAAAACLTLPPGASNITAADLHLEGVAPETVLSYAPMPGSQRVFHIPELQAIATRFRLNTTFDDDICVERAMKPLDAAKVTAAMQSELPSAKIEMLEISNQPAPPGELIFRRSGLRNNAVSGTVWMGAVRYAPNREYTVWAKVKLTVHTTK